EAGSRLSQGLGGSRLRSGQSTPESARTRLLDEQYEQVLRTHEHLCNVWGGGWGLARFRGRRMGNFFRIPTLVPREVANAVLRLLVSAPSRSARSCVDAHLHVL